MTKKKESKVIGHLVSLVDKLSYASWMFFGYPALDQMVHGGTLSASAVGSALIGAVTFVALQAGVLWLLKDK
ncbi:TPA: hypothetical protein ACYLN4_001148 [Burkholderia lata]